MWEPLIESNRIGDVAVNLGIVETRQIPLMQMIMDKPLTSAAAGGHISWCF